MDTQPSSAAPSAAVAHTDGHGPGNRPAPGGETFKVKIDREHYVFDTRYVTGRQLLAKAGKTPPEHYEIEKRVRGAYVPMGLDDTVDLADPGVEAFETFPLDETEG